MGPPDFSQVFTRLQGIEKTTQGWRCFCPVHQEGRSKGSKSLLVRCDERTCKLIFFCRRLPRCSNQEILSRLGLTFADLFGNKMDKTKLGKLTAVYPYRDEAGVLLYEKCRWLNEGEKTFTLRRPNVDFDRQSPPSKQNHRYLHGLKGTRRVIYRLPELLAQLSRYPDSTVFIHEGEKAVDLAWQCGLLSTCPPLGAGSWDHQSYVQPLVGRKVVVIEDDDPTFAKGCPGRDHAEQVCASLFGFASSLKKVRLCAGEQKGDFADWLFQQGGLDKKTEVRSTLRQLLTEIPEWFPDTSKMETNMRRLFGLLAQKRMKRSKEEIRSREEWFGKLRKVWLEFEQAVLLDGLPTEHALKLSVLLSLGLDQIDKVENGQADE